jgi:hypothetical protein
VNNASLISSVASAISPPMPPSGGREHRDVGRAVLAHIEERSDLGIMHLTWVDW